MVLTTKQQTIRPGYKQTEVGVIPVDWGVKRLGEIAELTSSKRIFESDYVPSGIPFYRGQEITSLIDGESIESACFIAQEQFGRIKVRFGVPRKGDILITAVGTLGNVYVVPNEDAFYFKDGNLIWLRRIDNADSQFVAAQIRKAKARILGNAIGSSQKALTIVVLKDVAIPLPSVPEQHAIATALSDVDALITSQNKLLAKKRDIKTAAVQQLLTGTSRLPGFSGEWEVKRLEDVADVDPENLASNTSPYYRFKYISLEDVDAGALRGYTEQMFRTAPSRARRRVRKGDVLVSTVRPNLKSHLLIRDDVADTVCSTGFSIVRSKPALSDPAFLYAHLFSGGIERQIESLLTGSNYPAISGRDVKALRIPCPSLPEQSAIAAVLSDMDTEIAALQAWRDKSHALKQGMMQKLLTGNIRLI